MESAQAQFIAMIVERIDTLKQKVEQQQEDIARLKQQNAQLENSLHLTDDLYEFSDGWSLDTNYWGQEEYRLEYASHQYCSHIPLDALHADATAFYGQVTFHAAFEQGPTPLSMGKKGERTTVQQMLDALRAWWQEYARSASEASVASTVAALELCAGWESGHMFNLSGFVPKFVL